MAEKFQRPERASLISTVPSETPHKHWLSGLIFAGICLNFLIVTVFWKFFGMFTVCSYSIMHLPFLMFPDSPITDRNRRITVL